MKSYKLKEICNKITDGSHNPPKGIDISEYLMISSKNINNDLISYSEPRYLEKELFESENKRTDIKRGDILLTIVGTVGRCAVYERDGKVVFQRSVAVIKPKKEIVNSRYLMYKLISMTNYFEKEARGVAQKGIYLKQLANIDINLPNLLIQEKMVKILDSAKLLINKRKEQIKMLDELVKSQFIEMFGDPINNPMKWEVKKMKDISTNIMSGNTPKGGEQVYVESGIMFLRSQNVWKNKLLLDDVAYIDEETHSKMKKSSLKHKDILMTKTGRINTENSSLGRAAIFLGEDDSANVNGHVYLIRLKEEILNEFVLFILTSKEYRGYIRSVCVGGIDKRQLNKEHIEDFPIIFPPIEQQEKFVTYVKQVDKLKFEMQNSLKELEDNFNSLMQRAFKGELLK
ncbi:restriction endonuclease subunit S [Clostridium botulinum]|nr:restriction endonuclease subunit S [Clostridium botulinum]